MNTAYSNRKLVVAISPDFKVQAAFDAFIATASLNARHPQTTPAFHNNVAFREETRNCTGEYVIIERITGKISRFTLGFDFTAKLGAGWFAYLQGVAAAPTGTPANETQTFSLGGATAGGTTVVLTYEGLSATSSVIPYNATNAQIVAILEAMRPIKKGSVAVTGTTTKTITFQGNLANANVPLMTIGTDTTTGGTGATLVAGANGENKLHAITRSASEQPAQFSIIEGFDDGTGAIKKYGNMVLDSWSVNLPRRGKGALTVVAYGSPDPELVTGYTVPACINQTPIKTADCRVKVASDWITEDLRELTYTESNNIDVSEDALRFDDVTPDQLERGDRTASLNMLSLGNPTSAMYAFAEAEETAFAAVELALGRPGERLTIYAPNTQFKLDDGLIEFVGTRNKSAFRLLGRPSPDGSDIVTRGDYHGAATTRFLLT